MEVTESLKVKRTRKVIIEFTRGTFNIRDPSSLRTADAFPVVPPTGNKSAVGRLGFEWLSLASDILANNVTVS